MARGADESNIPSSSEELDLTLPVHRPYWLNGSRAGQEGIRATWIGHATVLAEVDGTLVLTGKKYRLLLFHCPVNNFPSFFLDPIFSQRASLFQWTGPKRYRPPACQVQDLPENLHAVVISHTHFDHLDYNSVQSLQVGK